MTDEQRYAELLKAIGELLLRQNTVLKIQDFEIEQLKRKLSDAEDQMNDARKE